MAKKKPLSVDELTEKFSSVLKQFNAETDRGRILVASAYLDDLLGAAIRAMLVEDPLSDELVSEHGVINSFHHRIDAAYCLGLIGETERRDLHIIRKVRNECAHSHSKTTFNTMEEFIDQLAIDYDGSIRGEGEAKRWPAGRTFAVTWVYYYDTLCERAKLVRDKRLQLTDIQ